MEQSIVVDSSAETARNNFPETNRPISDEKVLKKETSEPRFVLWLFQKIISLSIFMIFFGLPLFFTGIASQGIVFEKQIYFYFWLLLGLVSWAAKGVIAGDMKIRKTPLDIPLVIFWLVYLAATIFSVDRWHSFWGMFGDPSRGLMSLTAVIIAYYLIFSNFTGKTYKLILMAVIGSGAIFSVWTMLAIRGIQFLPASIAQYAPLSLSGSAVGIGVFISALIPLILIATLKLAENENMNRIGKGILMGALLVVLALDLFLISALYNFIPWSGLFIGIGFLLVFILSRVVRPKENWAWLPMLVFVVIMALRMLGEVPIAKVNLPVEANPSYATSWGISLASMKDKFLLGSGPATYGYDFSLYKPKDFNLNTFYSLRFFQGTGVMFEAISTLGGFGAIALALVLLSFLSVEMYLLYTGKEKNKLYSLGLFCGSLIFLADALSVRVEGAMLILGALLGCVALAVTLQESDSEEKYINLSLKASPKFALALAFVFMVVSAGVAFLFVFLGKVYTADLYAGVAARQSSASQEDAIVRMGRAIQLNGKEPIYFSQVGKYYMALANAEAMKGEKDRDIQKIQQYLNYSISAMRQSGDMAKNDISIVEALAQVYENAGLYVADSLDLATQSYQRGLELEPHNPNFYERLGQIKLSLASTKKDEGERKQLINEAKDLFQKSVDEKNNFDKGHYQLSLVKQALGDMGGAIENGKAAVQIDSKNEDYLVSLGRMYQLRGSDDDLKVSEQIFKTIITANDSDINGHFYLGILYEKTKHRSEAKDQYRKVISLLTGDNVADTKKQLEKMVSNIDAGIENTPQNLGLTTTDDASSKQ